MDALRRGDPGALAAAYTAHAAPLLRSLTILLDNRADAEDAVHDLFVGLPEAVASYEERGAFGPWLNRIAVRMALMRLRQRRRRPHLTLDAAADLHRDAEAETLPDRLLLERTLRELPDPLRAVIVLRDLQGWSYRDIAHLLGEREGTTMTRHSRAMQRLRKLLREES